MSEPFHDRLPIDEFDKRRRAFDESPTGKFDELIALVGLDPFEDLQFGEFAKCSFEETDLRHFNFTGCDLRGATFEGAFIGGAIFDLATVSLSALRQAVDFDAWFAADIARRPEARRRIEPSRLPDLAAFREAAFAPEMVVIPAGVFLMGSDGDDDEAFDNEKSPDGRKREMRIPARFALGKYPVTFEEYLLFCTATNRKPPNDEGWGRDRRPAIHVSWNDAEAYAAWLNERFGVEAYGLPSEAQWEWACRARTNTRRWWGDAWDPARANGDHTFEKGRTSPVGHYGENDFKLADMIGNVWEWCADKWTQNLPDLPPDGRPYAAVPSRSRKQRKESVNSPVRALRGGSWINFPGNPRSAFRGGVDPDNRFVIVGFRLSRTL